MLMEIKIIDLPMITVIGKEGLCTAEKNIAQQLWQEANSHFNEVAALGMKNSDGTYVGFWGAMSDESRSFRPWTHRFTTGLYLAGVETDAEAAAPEGWTKWIVPSYEYIRVECVSKDTFLRGLQYLQDNSFELVGAVHDYTDSKTGKTYMLFPVRVLQTNFFEE